MAERRCQICRYDYALIDCMPSLGMLTINALTAADSVIIPVQAQYLPAKGLEQLLRTITRVKRQLNPKLEVDGIVLTISMKTARVPVPFCIAAAETGGFFHEQIGGDFNQQADFSCSVPLRR